MSGQTLIRWCLAVAAFSIHPAVAQDKYVDSLRTILWRKNLPDTDRINTLQALGDRLGYSDGPLARKYLDSAYSLAGLHRLYPKMGDALTGIAQAYYRTNNLDTCLLLLKRADTLYTRSDPNEVKGALVSSKMNIATILRTMGDYSTAIAMYLKGVNELEKLDIHDRQAKLMTAYMNIGLVYNEFNQYDKALYYHRKGLEFANGDAASDIRAYYLRLHRVHDLVELAQYDSARYYLIKEDTLYKKLAQPDILSQFYSNWGFYYLGVKDEPAAEEAFSKSYQYALTSNNEFRRVQSCCPIWQK